ncbi:MAG: hypothetical protein ISP90_03200 [Nevskia sp.]|nr:hypothetical protein [Nevskia sp.]
MHKLRLRGLHRRLPERASKLKVVRQQQESRLDVPGGGGSASGGLDHLTGSMPHPWEYPLMAELSLAQFGEVQIGLTRR